jgi:molybdate/tungstate transport system ATP-binding protein
VRHNISYGLRAHGQSRRALRESVAAAARQVGIEDLLARGPNTLSGGEQQRVALARALVVSPSLVLLDEPLSAVDLRMRRELRGELRKLHREAGTTFLHVTHDVDEALQLGQRIGVMLDGRIHQVGTPEQLFQHPSDPQAADFLGMRNVMPITDYDGEACRVDGELIHVGRRPEPFSHVWIRPEEILLSREPFSSSARNQWRAIVRDWELRDVFVAVRVTTGELTLCALVTYASFRELALNAGAEAYVTFKSTSVHCF